ncbi:cytidylate kinase [Brevinema andersonii]|uniref:Cytidylate kinase n=2 Tax=Brevinema andersonii TaxID=34097 RepID=A0A1I1DFD2_BREAD|nr:cytidylate kinase [Brevinema andersonii]
MIITIDGPAGAGKSSISKKVAQELGFMVLDTGAMYRCVAYFMDKQNLTLEELLNHDMLSDFTVEFWDGKVFLNGENVSSLIRTPEIDKRASEVSQNAYVRSVMQDLQRLIARGTNIVAEGRDMGSAVFPDAELKIYLDASPEIRAERRRMQLLQRGITVDKDQLLQKMICRDYDDSNRAISPLCVPKNAIVINTDHIFPSEVLDKIVSLAKKLIRSEL